MSKDKSYWTPKRDQLLTELWHDGYRQQLTDVFKNVSYGAIRSRAYRIGLRGSAEHNTDQGPAPSEPAEPKHLPILQQIAYDKQIVGLQSEVSLLRTKNKELMKQTNAQERILQYNKLAIDALPPVEAPKAPKITKSHTVETAVLALACHHIGEVINPAEMGGLNAFNFDVYSRRLQNLIERTIKFTTQNMQSHRFERLHVFMLGDAVNGIIHAELENTNELNIVEQAHLGSLVFAQALQDLAREFPEVIFTGVPGNHGRTKHEKYSKGKSQINWDYVFYNNLALLLRDQKNIKFNIPLTFWAGVQIYDWKFLLQHGDGVKSWGSIPFYGIGRAANMWREIYSVNRGYFNYFVMAHFHTKVSLQTSSGELIAVGSLKGGDEYAQSLYLFNRPSQTLFGVHSKYGKTWELNIDPSQGQDDLTPRYKYDRSVALAAQI